jgi:prepilin-type N-terminal cleavage/methylation domain-containing protein
VKAADTDRSTEYGFTLLEMLVSLTVLAVMAGYAVNVIGRFADMRRIETATQQRQVLVTARRHLRDTIGGARVRFDPAEVGSTYFKGSVDSLTISNVLDERLVFGGLQNITYRLFEGNLAFDINGLKQNRANVLLSDVDQLRFTYFGQPSSGLPKTWQDTWTSKELPDLVRINFTMKTETGLPSQQLDIALAVSMR